MASSADVMLRSPHDAAMADPTAGAMAGVMAGVMADAATAVATAAPGPSAAPVPEPPATLVAIRPPRRERWVPSRFNARTLHPDGRLVLWNTWTGAISVFPAERVAAVEALLSQAGFEGAIDGLARYLFERGFLVSREVDERRRLRTAFGQQQYRTDLLELILLASEDCNFRCTYCYEDFQRGTMRPEVREGVKNLVRHRIRALRELRVSWFGGEPLYGWEAIEDLAPFCKAMAEEHGVRYTADMTTNGYLLTPERQERLLAWGVRTFQITLDGFAETHDRSRKGRDGRATWATIVRNLDAMHRRPEPFKIQLRVNYDRDNHPTLHRWLEWVRERFEGDARFVPQFHAVGRWGGDNDPNLAVCGVEESRQVRYQLRRRSRELGMSTGHGVSDLHLPNHGTGVCYAARPYNFIVGATGKLMKCTITLDKADYNLVGQLHPDGAMELDADRLARWTEPPFEEDKVCGSCHVSPMCQGLHCPMVRIETGKRACMSVKGNLRDDLLETVEILEGVGRSRVRQLAQA